MGLARFLKPAKVVPECFGATYAIGVLPFYWQGGGFHLRTVIYPTDRRATGEYWDPTGLLFCPYGRTLERPLERWWGAFF